MASQYLKWKYRDVKPDAPMEMTKAQRRANWWHYNKWYVLGACLLLLVVGMFAWDKVQDWQNRPDYQIAYVGTSYLPEGMAEQIEETFTALAEDANDNGKITVQLNQYVFLTDDPEIAESASVLLTSDILDCESYYFLLEDPAWFQESFHALCRLDGSLPEVGDESVEDACLPWPGAELYLARRGFWDEKTTANPEACGALWERLTEGILWEELMEGMQ